MEETGNGTVVVIGDSIMRDAAAAYPRFFGESDIIVNTLPKRSLSDVTEIVSCLACALAQCSRVQCVVVMLGSNDAISLACEQTSLQEIRHSIVQLENGLNFAICESVIKRGNTVAFEEAVRWLLPPFAASHSSISVNIVNGYIEQLHNIITETVQCVLPVVHPLNEVHLYTDGGYQLNSKAQLSLLLRLHAEMGVRNVGLLARYIQDPVVTKYRRFNRSANANWACLLANMQTSRLPTFCVVNLSGDVMTTIVQNMLYSNVEPTNSAFKFLKILMPCLSSLLKRRMVNLREVGGWQTVFNEYNNFNWFDDNHLSCELCRTCIHANFNRKNHFSAYAHRFKLSNLLTLHMFEEQSHVISSLEGSQRKFRCVPNYHNRTVVCTDVKPLANPTNQFIRSTDHTHLLGELDTNAVMARLVVVLPCRESDHNAMLHFNDPDIAGIEIVQIAGMYGIRLFANCHESHALNSSHTVGFHLRYWVQSAVSAGLHGPCHGIPQAKHELTMFLNKPTDRFQLHEFSETATYLNTRHNLEIALTCNHVGSFWTALELGLAISTKEKDELGKAIAREHYNRCIIPLCVVRSSSQMGWNHLPHDQQIEQMRMCRKMKRDYAENPCRPSEYYFDSGYKDSEVQKQQAICHILEDKTRDELSYLQPQNSAFALLSIQGQLSSDVINFNEELRKKWEAMGSVGVLGDRSNYFPKFHLSEPATVFRNEDIVQFFAKRPPTSTDYFSVISTENFFQWLNNHSLLYLANNFAMQQIACDVVEAAESHVLLCTRSNGVPSGEWKNNNCWPQSVIMQYVDVAGVNFRQFQLEDLSITEIDDEQHTVRIQFRQIEEWTDFLRCALVRSEDIVPQLKLYECGQYSSAEWHYVFLSSAVLEFSGVGPTATACVKELQSEAVYKSGLNTDSACCATAALELWTITESLYSAGSRFTSFIKLFFTKDFQPENMFHVDQKTQRCNATTETECTCGHEEANLEYQSSRIIDIMTSGLSNEMILEGPTGSGKSTILSKLVAHIQRNFTEEIVLVLSYKNEDLTELAKKIRCECYSQRIESTCPSVAVLSRYCIGNFTTIWQSIGIVVITMPSCGEDEMGVTDETLRRILKSSRIIFSTVDMAYQWMSRLRNDQLNIKWVIIDEASHVPLLPFFSIISRAQKFIIAGDCNHNSIAFLQQEKYLLPFYVYTSALTFMSQLCYCHTDSFKSLHHIRLYSSAVLSSETCTLVSRLLPREHCFTRTTYSYANEQFDFLRQNSAFIKKAFCNRGLCFLHVSGQQLDIGDSSFVNAEEVFTIWRLVQLLSEIAQGFRDKYKEFRLGILAANQCQVNVIQRFIIRNIGYMPEWVKSGTVKSLEAEHFHVTILSCIESSYDDAIGCPRLTTGFLLEMCDAEIALTRHTLASFIVCNAYRFLQRNSVMKKLLSECGAEILYFDRETETGLSCDIQTLTAWLARTVNASGDLSEAVSTLTERRE